MGNNSRRAQAQTEEPQNEVVKKGYENNEFVKNFVATYKANHPGKDLTKLTNRVVGNNGYAVDQSFTLTGEIGIGEVKDDKGKVTATYVVLKTEEGTDLSLMQLMGVSSLRGYAERGTELIEEYDNQQGKKQERKIVGDFDHEEFASCWKPKTRVFLELAAMIADKVEDLTGKTVTFRGTACKQTTAKDAGESFGEKYKKDYKRVIQTKMWTIV